MTEELGFERAPVSSAGVPGVPLELQLLGVLRVLGRATCFDGIEELTGASAEAHRVFFHTFCERFSKKYYDEYVYLPRTAEETANWARDYSLMGLTGAIGSTDCVHLHWDRCPHGLVNLCTGKEGYPSLAYQATVNHKMRFMSSTKGFFGSMNDKSICKYDKFTQDLKAKRVFAEQEYTLYDENGEPTIEKGYYLICDGGFCNWKCLITGFKYYSNLNEALWSAQMESTRKDIERAFGILKGRFRCLKLPILFQKKHYIDYMFWTCVILHNMIMTADGRDELWKNETDWLGDAGEHDLFDDEWSISKMSVIHKRALSKLTNYSYISRRYVRYQEPEYEDDYEDSFHSFRIKLVKNYGYLHETKQVRWLN
jgi:hypothetical protein